MDTKICTKCKRELPLDNFRWKNKALGKKHSQCKDCQKKQEHLHYQESSERQNSVKLNAKIQKNNNILFIEKEKEQGCCKCGEKRSYLLDFHHINPNEKINDISRLIKSGSLQSIKEEVKKCIILCSNCHREFHFLERNHGIKLEDFLKNTN